MISSKKPQKNVEEDFRSFLWSLEDFLNSNALFYTKDLTIVYCQEPQTNLYGYIARGLMQLEGGYTFPFKVEFDMDINTLSIESEAFTFYLSYDEFQKFLKQMKEKKGGKQ